jgi:hypothetical protein
MSLRRRMVPLFHTLPTLDHSKPRLLRVIQMLLLHPTPLPHHTAAKLTCLQVWAGRTTSGPEIHTQIKKNSIHVSRLSPFAYFLIREQIIKFTERGHSSGERYAISTSYPRSESHKKQIFKVLWAEPKGAETGGSGGQSGTGSVTVRKVPGGKETYAKVRRFVIIKPMEGHCICLLVTTHSFVPPG